MVVIGGRASGFPSSSQAMPNSSISYPWIKPFSDHGSISDQQIPFFPARGMKMNNIIWRKKNCKSGFGPFSGIPLLVGDAGIFSYLCEPTLTPATSPHNNSYLKSQPVI
ncbi:hypothetical protein L1049_003427 [Liquidambar formosana]|uniref:Uncharacterized protein n=1 Tax=Liquidambar formosana TaxID=63359 RepID=A0AAP0N5K0_LIQFO